MKNTDYSRRLVWLTLVVCLGAVSLGLIPSFELFGMTIPKVDMLSSLRDEARGEDVVEYEADIARLEEELAALAAPVEEAVDTMPEPLPVRYEWIIEAEEEVEHVALRSLDVRPEGVVVPIEDFDTLALTRYQRLIERLAAGEDVRIAFMGDSFVEGDILTCDLRDALQSLVGGRGVGFVACDIPFATVRKSVKRSSSGWTAYSVMKPKSTPEALRDRFFISGYIADGGVGATTCWETTSQYATLEGCTRGRVLLYSRDTSRVEVVVNDTLRQEFEIAGDGSVREIYVQMPMSSLRLRVLDGSVLCYGASLEGGRGVMVDNYSVRSNNGHAIFGTGATVNRQIDEMLGYDLVVLQYGLNIMQQGQRGYSRYRDQLRDMIAYAERCFPDAAILVMGVSDRWVKGDSGSYEPIGSVDALTSYQRAAADSTKVAFWNTSQAMEALGGMPAFVSNGWAAKDYTHINFAGGKRVAGALVMALRQSLYDYLVECEAEAARREEEARQREEEARQREVEAQQRLEEQINGIRPMLDSVDIGVAGVLSKVEE